MSETLLKMSKEAFVASLKQAEEAGYRRGVAESRTYKTQAGEAFKKPIIMDDEDAILAAIYHSGC